VTGPNQGSTRSDRATTTTTEDEADMANGTSGADGDLPTRIAELATPLADAEGIELVDVEVKGQRNRRVVRLVADAEGGLDVDRIAALSRAVGDLIDEHDVVPGSYTLEVTSPGADRPLRTARDFRRNIGRDVRVTRTEAAAQTPERKGELTGTLVGADDEAITIEVQGSEHRIELTEIDYGKVVLPW
jgi:ribosome maturation factor RimP